MTKEEKMKIIVRTVRVIKIQTLLWGWSWCVVAYIGTQLLSGEGHFAWPIQVLLFAANAVVALWTNPFKKGGVLNITVEQLYEKEKN
jgi:hypothetical protein